MKALSPQRLPRTSQFMASPDKAIRILLVNTIQDLVSGSYRIPQRTHLHNWSLKMYSRNIHLAVEALAALLSGSMSKVASSSNTNAHSTLGSA